MVDNIPIIKPFHISNLFSAFSGEIIQTADLYAGGFGARYSGATSAILDIRLRPGNMRQKSGMIAASPYMGALKLEGPLEKDRQSFLLMGRYSLMEYTTSILTQSKQEVRFVDAVGKYTIQGESITCNITGVYTYDQGIINPLREFNLSWSNKVEGARCLGFDHFFTYPLEATFGYTGYTNWEGSLFQDSRRSSISQLFLKVDNKGNMFNHPVNYGFGLTLGLYKARLEERFTAVRSFRDRNPVLNFYMSSEFNPVTQLTLQPGFASQMSIDANPTFEPRFRMSYKPGNSGKREFSFAAGRYYQFLSAISDERDAGTVFMAWIPRLSNDLVPSSTHLMAGYRDELLQMVHIQFEIYTKWHQNIPVSKWTPIAELEIETAYADGFTYGADLNLEIDQAPWYATLSYGLAYIKYESISGDLGAWIEDVIFGYNPPHDQRHKIHISSGFKVGEYNINTSWEYGSGQPYTRVFGFDLFLNIPRRFPTDYPGIARTLYSEPYGERLPSYHRLDFTVERTFLLKSSIELTMKAGALNLYNRNNIFYFDLNTLQRVDQTSFMPFISSELHF